MYNNFEKHGTQKYTYDRDPQAVAELNDAYNSRLYGNIGENHLAENPSLHDEGYATDASDKLFTEAATLAAERDRNLHADKERGDGHMTVKVLYEGQEVIVRRAEDWFVQEHPGTPLCIIEFPQVTIEYNGVKGTQQQTMCEIAPGRWEMQISNLIQFGDEADLPAEQRSGVRGATSHEALMKDSILYNSSIDPDRQHDLSTSHGQSVAASPAVDQLTQEAYKLAA